MYAALIAQAANYVALRNFYCWYSYQTEKSGDNAFHNTNWLAVVLTSSQNMTILFPYVAKRFEEVLEVLSSEWQIQGCLSLHHHAYRTAENNTQSLNS